MSDVAGTDAEAREPWRSRVPLRTMAIWLALVVIVFLTRRRWEAWVVERELPARWETSFAGLAISPDGTRLLLRYHSGEMELWDIRSGRILARFRSERRRWLWEPFSRNGERLVVIGDGVALNAPIPEGDPARGKDLPTHIVDARSGESVLCLPESGWPSLSPDGRFFVELAFGGAVEIRSAETGEAVVLLPAHEDDITCAVYSPDGRLIATYPELGTPPSVRTWNAHTGELVAVMSGDFEVMHVGFSPSMERLFARSDNGEAWYIWDVRTGRLVARIDCSPGASHEVSDDGSLLVTGHPCREGAQVWELDAAKRLCRICGPVEEFVDLSAEARRLATRAGQDVVVYDLETGARHLSIPWPYGRGESWNLPSITPDGMRVIVGGTMGRSAHVWDAETGDLLAVLPCGFRFEVMSNDRLFDPDSDGHLIYRRIRPEYWWGVFHLRHFWVIVALSVALGLSIRKDVRDLRRRP